LKLQILAKKNSKPVIQLTQLNQGME